MNGHDKGQHYRLYRISERLILTVLGQWKRFDCVALPEPLDLPDGWEIHGVEYSLATRGFALLVWHPTFPVVALGAIPPLAACELSFKETLLKLDPDGVYRKPKATKA